LGAAVAAVDDDGVVAVVHKASVENPTSVRRVEA
jgi:hypothetical protein